MSHFSQLLDPVDIVIIYGVRLHLQMFAIGTGFVICNFYDQVWVSDFLRLPGFGNLIEQ